MAGRERTESIRRWASSGCRSLTGSATRAGLGPPEGFVEGLERLAERLAVASATVGEAVTVDSLAEIAMRGRFTGLIRRGRTSCGGMSRIITCSDGAIALTLSRETDFGLVPALVEHPVAPGEDSAWEAVVRLAARSTSETFVERAELLGLAAAQVGEPPPAASAATTPVHVTSTIRTRSRTTWRDSQRPPRVLDLSALWAGPLCGQLLGLAGCEVVKVESHNRPDGARFGAPAVYARLNRGKRSVAIDPATAEGIAVVASLIAVADVVIEASRPRALAAWGVGPGDISSPCVWVSITAHGYRGAGATRVGFGDDVAAGAGLVATDADGPSFCADAIADPLTGIAAATIALEALANEQPCHLDVAMIDVARQFAGRTVEIDNSIPNATDQQWSGRLPTMRGPVANVGDDTADVLEQWCRG